MDGRARVFHYMTAPGTVDRARLPREDDVTPRDRVALAIRIFTLGMPCDPVSTTHLIDRIMGAEDNSLIYTRFVAKHPAAFVYTAFARARACICPTDPPTSTDYYYASTPGGAYGHALLHNAGYVAGPDDRSLLDIAEGVLALVLGGENAVNTVSIIRSALSHHGYTDNRYDDRTRVALAKASEIAQRLGTEWTDCSHYDADAAPLAMAPFYLALYLAYAVHCPDMPTQWTRVEPNKNGSTPPDDLLRTALDWIYPHLWPVQDSSSAARLQDLYAREYHAGTERTVEFDRLYPGVSFVEARVAPEVDPFRYLLDEKRLPVAYMPINPRIFDATSRLCPFAFFQTISDTPDNTAAQRNTVACVDCRNRVWVCVNVGQDADTAARFEAQTQEFGTAMPPVLRAGGLRFILEEVGANAAPPAGLEAYRYQRAQFVRTADGRVVLSARSLFL